jgi:hypothetical protein
MSILYRHVTTRLLAMSRRARVALAAATTLAALLLIVVAAEASKNVIASFGSTGTEGGQFTTVGGDAVNQDGAGGVEAGSVYVVDSGGNRVQQFSATGGFVRAFGWEVVKSGLDATGGFEVCEAAAGDVCQAAAAAAGDGAMSSPQDVAVDQSNGNLYVTDQGNRRVDVFSATGRFQGAWGVDLDASSPASELQFCPAGDTCQAGASNSGAAGAFGSALDGIAIDPANEDVLVADASNRRIDEFAPTVAAGTVTGVKLAKAFGRGVVSYGPDNDGTAAVQQIKVVASSGSFTLSFASQTTGTLPYDASAAEVETALNALSSIGGAHGSVTVSGGPGSETGANPYVVTFGGSLKGVEPEQTKIETAGLGVPVGTGLTCSSSGTGIAYQWLRDGQPIAGQTAATYTTTSEDEGEAVQCQVIGGTAGYPTIQMTRPATVTSPFPAVAPPVPAENKLPKPTGTIATGGKLKCATGTWSGSASFAYQWYKDGASLGSEDGAQSSEYTVQNTTKAVYQCVVTATNAGGSTMLASENTHTTPTTFFPVQVLPIVSTPTTVTTTTKGSAGYEICVPTNGDVCRTGVEGSEAGAFGASGPISVAAGPSGEIYAVDPSNLRVQKFEAAATSPAVFDAATASGTSAATAPKLLTVEEASGEVYLVKPNSAGSELLVLRISPAEALLETDAEGNGITVASGIAYAQSSGDIYLAVPLVGAQQVDILNEVAAPAVSIEAVTDQTATSATFHGTVDPNPNPVTSFPATYRFEYSADGTHWSAVPIEAEGEASAGDGSSAQPVQQTVTGLSPSTLYLVRLRATGTGGVSTSNEVSFSTAGAAPTILESYGVATGESSATLYGEIDPNNQGTSYYFQYITQAEYQASGFEDAARVPAGERHIGSGSQPVAVSETFAGLQGNTGYVFRIVATNASGAPVDGPAREFTTASAASESCPNEALRAEDNSTALPDCRAYEMVTPPYKEGAGVSYTFAGMQVADEGQDVVFNDAGLFAGAENSDKGGEATAYESNRQADGWQTTALNPSPTLSRKLNSRAGTSVDGSSTLWELGEPTVLYRREASGEFVEIGPTHPPGTPPANTKTGGENHSRSAEFVGGSADLSRTLFQISDLFWPGDSTPEYNAETASKGSAAGAAESLYEYAGTGNETPVLVSEDDTGQQLTQCGTWIAGKAGISAAHSKEHAISAEGSTVFFEAPYKPGCSGPSVNQLYARVGTQPASATVINLAATSGCEASPYCDVTKPVTFDGAASDGARVFFTSEQNLQPAAGGEELKLYECALPGDGGAQPAPEEAGGVVSPVNRCPAMKLVSAAESGGAADVQGVVRVSADGARVYYVATGIVTGQPNLLGQSAQAGADNMYLYDAETGQTKFIATLAATDSTDWLGDSEERPQTTPEGEYLVFASTAQLTPDDTSSVAQVFRYDAANGQLVRVSIGQGGYADDSNAETQPALIPPPNQGNFGPALAQMGAISSDGQQVIFGSEAVLSEDAVAGQTNVYEYEQGNVRLIYTGPTFSNGGLKGELVHAGIDASGRDIFFATARQLVGQDTDTVVDYYDARVAGGVPAPPAAALQCDGEACQGPFSPILSEAKIGSTSAPTVGNLATPPEKKVEEEPAKKVGKVKIAKRAAHANTVVLTVNAPAKGELTATGKGLKKATKSVKGKGTYKLELKLTAAEQKKLARKKTLTLKVKVAFTSESGEASSATTSVKLKS